MVIIDAYNVLHRTGVLPPSLAGPDLKELCGLIARSRYASRSPLLVCDGGPPGDPDPASDRSFRVSFQGVEVLYAGKGIEADDAIERLVLAHSAPKRLTVVSSDRRVQRVGKRKRARVLDADVFLGQLAADAGKRQAKLPPYPKTPLAHDEVDGWMREFGFGPARRASAQSLTDRAGKPTEEPSKKPSQKSEASKRAPPVSRKSERRSGHKDEAGEQVGGLKGSTLDPLLLEALEHWGESLRIEELDMRHWLANDDTGGKEPRG